MSEDTLLQEVRAAREEYARAHGFDVHRIVADLQAMNRSGDWKVVRLPPRKPKLAVEFTPAPRQTGTSSGESTVARQ